MAEYLERETAVMRLMQDGCSASRRCHTAMDQRQGQIAGRWRERPHLV